MVAIWTLLIRQFRCISPVWGWGWGAAGTGGIGVRLPPPLILIRVWSWLCQGKKGGRGQASVFSPSSYEPFTLVSNLWWEWEGKKNIESWGGVGWQAGRHPEQARVTAMRLVILGLVMEPMCREPGPLGQKATRGLNKYNIFIWH